MENSHTSKKFSWIEIVGVALILLGVLGYLAIKFSIYWLPAIVGPMVGAVLIFSGIRHPGARSIIAGSVLFLVGLGGVFLLIPVNNASFALKIGIFFVVISVVWCLVTIITAIYKKAPAWWALIPGGIFLGFGCVFIFTNLRLVDFVLFLSLGIVIPFLIWGVASRLLGLIIPGSILAGIGPGVYVAWGKIGEPNGLTQTGIMLVCFALGWMLITLFSKFITNKIIWWPLIPGGILAMVGWGLYIGGDPDNAASFIGNTGSIALVLVGAYLLLLRRGIRS